MAFCPVKNRSTHRAEQTSCSVKELPKMRLARASSPAPRAMEKRGTPPVPNRAAKPMIRVTMGKVRPTPVRAMPPPSPMWPR